MVKYLQKVWPVFQYREIRVCDQRRGDELWRNTLQPLHGSIRVTVYLTRSCGRQSQISGSDTANLFRAIKLGACLPKSMRIGQSYTICNCNFRILWMGLSERGVEFHSPIIVPAAES